MTSVPSLKSKWDDDDEDDEPTYNEAQKFSLGSDKNQLVAAASITQGPPPYGSRKGFIPRTAKV